MSARLARGPSNARRARSFLSEYARTKLCFPLFLGPVLWVHYTLLEHLPAHNGMVRAAWSGNRIPIEYPFRDKKKGRGACNQLSLKTKRNCLHYGRSLHENPDPEKNESIPGIRSRPHWRRPVQECLPYSSGSSSSFAQYTLSWMVVSSGDGRNALLLFVEGLTQEILLPVMRL